MKKNKLYYFGEVIPVDNSVENVEKCCYMGVYVSMTILRQGKEQILSVIWTKIGDKEEYFTKENILVFFYG